MKMVSLSQIICLVKLFQKGIVVTTSDAHWTIPDKICPPQRGHRNRNSRFFLITEFRYIFTGSIQDFLLTMPVVIIEGIGIPDQIFCHIRRETVGINSSFFFKEWREFRSILNKFYVPSNHFMRNL